MLKNFIKHSFRSFKRQRSYIIINILGLTIGIACSLLIALYVLYEASYDRFNVKRDRIYRLVINGKIGGQEVIGSYTPSVMGPTMAKDYPEIEACLRLNNWGATVVEYNNQSFTDDNVVEADSSFFDIFSIPLVKGDISNLLNAPHRAVISESTARKIFGSDDPIDRLIKVGTDSTRYVVSGVMSDIPGNCHFEASILLSFMTNPRSQDPTWMNNSFSTYLLLKPKTDYKAVEAKIPQLLEKHVGPELEKYMGVSIEDFISQGNRYGYFLQNLTDIHLDNTVQQEFKEASDPKYLYIFGSIAILIILIAAINFMNLSTAQAAKRAKEVGIKKVSGSTRGMLISQFLSESFILAFISLILAVIIIKLSLPYFNNLLQSSLTLGLLAKWYTIPVLLLFSVFVGVLAGSYPAFFLSSFNPYEVLKGSVRNSVKNGYLRRILVVFQFAISIMLIVGTMIMYRQINYMLNKDVGFDKEQLIVINRINALGDGVKSFKEAVKGITGVANISASTAVPGRNNNNNGYRIEGRKDESFLVMSNWVDYDYIDTYGMKMVEGRAFDKSYLTDKDACMINEAAKSEFNIKDLETTRFMRPGDEGEFLYLSVVGVVQNFNFESLRNPVGPYMMLFRDDNVRWGYITVRLLPGDYPRTIREIEKVWKDYTANVPMQYYFMDEDFAHMYIQEKQNAKMAVMFSILAILVAALGLFGLTSFTVEQRTKEIGVRKAMGSSAAGIYVVISREIVLLVLIAALFAGPAVYYFAGNWLENFYYRIHLGVFSFAAGLLIAMGTAVLTVSYRIMRAARINPAQSLKYE